MSSGRKFHWAVPYSIVVSWIGGLLVLASFYKYSTEYANFTLHILGPQYTHYTTHGSAPWQFRMRHAQIPYLGSSARREKRKFACLTTRDDDERSEIMVIITVIIVEFY